MQHRVTFQVILANPFPTRAVCSCGWLGMPQPRAALACSEGEAHVMECFDVVAAAERIAWEAAA